MASLIWLVYFPLLGGEGLKYSTSGQTQFYAFTVLLGVGVLGMFG